MPSSYVSLELVSMSESQTNTQWSCYFYTSRIADSSDISSHTQNYFRLDNTIRCLWWLPRAILKTTLFIIKTKKIFLLSSRTMEWEIEIIGAVLGKSFVLIINNILWALLRCPSCECLAGLQLAEKYRYVFWSSRQNKANCNYAVCDFFLHSSPPPAPIFNNTTCTQGGGLVFLKKRCSASCLGM